MMKQLRQRAILMLFFLFFVFCLGCLVSCSNTATNLKKLDEAFSSGDYARTMQLATQYLNNDFQSGYLLYKGVSAAFLRLPDESSRALGLYLAMTSESDDGRPLALRTMLDTATQTGSLGQVISTAYELEDIGQGTLKSRKELYKALLVTGEQEQAEQVLNDMLSPMLAPKELCLLAVDAKASTSLLVSSLEAWLSELDKEDASLFLSTYAAAVETARFRQDGEMLLPITKGVYEGGLYTEVGDASLVARCLGDLYASSGQKVLARRFWNEAVRLDGNSIAQERLAAL